MKTLKSFKAKNKLENIFPSSQKNFCVVAKNPPPLSCSRKAVRCHMLPQHVLSLPFSNTKNSLLKLKNLQNFFILVTEIALKNSETAISLQFVIFAVIFLWFVPILASSTRQNSIESSIDCWGKKSFMIAQQCDDKWLIVDF